VTVTEQLIQAVLNVAHNAAQALGDRIAAGDAQIIFKTRIARQAFGKAAVSAGTGIACH
jgi:two-component system nitrogen regulation sensor histidine kinase GlnL